MNFLLVFIGGGLGTILRYQIGLWLQKTIASLPWATFIANISACVVFAIIIWFSTFKIINQSSLKLLLLTGFCGGLSTFSAFSYETFLLFKQGLMFYALLNIFINTSTCIFIFYLLSSKLF